MVCGIVKSQNMTSSANKMATESKFKHLRQLRQQEFSASRYKKIPFSFEGKDRNVYSNANLSLFVNESCNANCTFCIDQLRFENKGKTFTKGRIASDRDYFYRLEQVLDYVRPLNMSISITGGEPTKSPRLARILKLVEKYDFRKRVITTNGSGLLDIQDGKRIIDHLVNCGFHHLNISKTHYDEALNDRFMQFENSYFSNEKMAQVVAIAMAGNLRPRLSCLLLKEGIHDIPGIVKYLDYYASLGVDNIIFRETMDYDEVIMRNYPKLEFLKRNKVYLNDIWEEIDYDSRFTPITQVLGYYYYVEVYHYAGVDMVTESASLTSIDEQKDKARDMVFEMIFHPNGNLNASWVENEDILLPYQP